MSIYKVPLNDIRFSMFEVNGYQEHYDDFGRRAGNEELLSAATVEAVFEQAAKFSEQELFPLNAVGDREGAKLNDGEVTTPTGFKKAYQQFVEAGWPSLAQPEQFGGQGLPSSLSIALTELWQTANAGWSGYGLLGEGIAVTINAHGDDETKQIYLPKLISGEWLGSMCLTEPHCGSDLGLLQTKAVPDENGDYLISGSKIFITSGEHNLTDNIIHLVLARLPDAPAGVKGISMFLVPKYLIDSDGNLADKNGVVCSSVEDKMGLNGSGTCSMNFDSARGVLIGTANKGLSQMFTLVNKARLGVAIQGYGIAEGAWQLSHAYATERLQGRALGGATAPEKIADPIIVHDDVQRMLSTQKSFIDGGRVLVHSLAKLVDLKASSDQEQAAKAEDRLALLTPIAKACLSEWGHESADLGVQIHGGHGYVKDLGVEQRVRDVRITRIYEGTTGIQALDLLARKVLGGKKHALIDYTSEIIEFCATCADIDGLDKLANQLETLVGRWLDLTDQIEQVAEKDRSSLGAVAFDYLMLSGYIVLAHQWLRSAVVAKQQLTKGKSDPQFYQAKISTAEFYFVRLLPRVETHFVVINALIEGATKAA